MAFVLWSAGCGGPPASASAAATVSSGNAARPNRSTWRSWRFYAQNWTIRRRTIGQITDTNAYCCTIKKGYALMFILTYTSQDDKASLLDVMKTLQFN